MFAQINRQITSMDRETKLQWFAALVLGLVYVAATGFIPGPDDLYSYYLPFAEGCLECGFVPYYAQWFLWPLTLLPLNSIWPVWTFISVFVVLLVHYLRRTNPVPILLTFPMMAQFWLGQIDALVILGLALVMGYLGKHPLLKGIGVLLALIKPQISLPALLFIFWDWDWDERLKVGGVAAVGFFISLFQYGFSWPIEWLTNARSLGVHLWRQPATLFFPIGLITLLIPLYFRESSAKIRAALVSAAFIPQHSIYSHLVFLNFMKPTSWWVVPLSLVWLLFIPVLDSSATTISMLLPLAVLAKMIWDQRKKLREREENEAVSSGKE